MGVVFGTGLRIVLGIHRPATGPRRRPPYRVVMWLAVVAMLCQALVPVYAMALDDGAAGGRVPICTGSGIVWVSLDADGQPVAPDSPEDPEPDKATPCPYCLAQITPAALPGGAILQTRATPILHERSAIPADRPRAGDRHTTRQSRAPPVTL